MQEKSRTEKRELEREQGQHKERERERESNKERERPLRILIEETASLKRRQSTNALRSDMLPERNLVQRWVEQDPSPPFCCISLAINRPRIFLTGTGTANSMTPEKVHYWRLTKLNACISKQTKRTNHILFETSVNVVHYLH